MTDPRLQDKQNTLSLAAREFTLASGVLLFPPAMSLTELLEGKL